MEDEVTVRDNILTSLPSHTEIVRVHYGKI